MAFSELMSREPNPAAAAMLSSAGNFSFGRQAKQRWNENMASGGKGRFGDEGVRQQLESAAQVSSDGATKALFGPAAANLRYAGQALGLDLDNRANIKGERMAAVAQQNLANERAQEASRREGIQTAFGIGNLLLGVGGLFV